MKKGFSLIEMLVVIGIIAVLIGATTGGYMVFVNRAHRARCVELVSNVHTALDAILQKEDAWPRAILNEGQGGNGQMTKEVGASMARRGVISLTYRKTSSNGQYTYELTGLDQCGIVSPWAAAVIKRKLASGSVSDGTKVPEGGTIADHRLRFAVDDDYDGYTDVQVRIGSASGGATVRASSCVWCCGRDGKFGTRDDVYSWSKGQEQ